MVNFRAMGFYFVFKEISQRQHDDTHRIIPCDLKSDMGHKRFIMQL